MIQINGKMVRMTTEDLREIYWETELREKTVSELEKQIESMEEHISKIETALEKTWRENRSILGLSD